MLTIPKPILNALDLCADAPVRLSIESGKLVVKPNRRPRYSLDELLAQRRPTARRSRADREWTSGKRAGRELI
jgi:antitoxin ChpS